ncbi:16602_t:CDS:2, partial [Entrophospora sp. SA101]
IDDDTKSNIENIWKMKDNIKNLLVKYNVYVSKNYDERSSVINHEELLSIICEKPFQNYELLWCQDIYKIFVAEFCYSDEIINPLIAKAFSMILNILHG